MTRLLTWRRMLMLVCALFVGSFAVVLPAQPASATHLVTNCNNDATGMDEIYFEWHNVVFVGVDLGLGDILGTESRAFCVSVLGGTAQNLLVDVFNAPAGFTGRTIQVRLCNPTCTTLVGQTGVFVNLAAPLFSCIYLDGVQQNPGCPLP